MKRRTRKPSPAELELWRAATRDITPLPDRAGPEAPAEEGAAAPLSGPSQRPPAAPRRVALKATTASVAPPPAPLPPATPPAAELAHGRGAGLDRRQADRLRRGRTPIEARLDLHGMTQAEAHDRLKSFVAGAAADGKRCVLVITGKGLGRDGTGVLRESVPRWLNEPPLRAHVLLFDYAQPRHGGAGALYVLLKRKR